LYRKLGGGKIEGGVKRSLGDPIRIARRWGQEEGGRRYYFEAAERDGDAKKRNCGYEPRNLEIVSRRERKKKSSGSKKRLFGGVTGGIKNQQGEKRNIQKANEKTKRKSLQTSEELVCKGGREGGGRK